MLILGAGSISSVVALALNEARWAAAIQDDPPPPRAHLRRGMAFADALWDGRADVAGLAALRADDAQTLVEILAIREAVAIMGLALEDVPASRPWRCRWMRGAQAS